MLNWPSGLLKINVLTVWIYFTQFYNFIRKHHTNLEQGRLIKASLYSTVKDFALKINVRKTSEYLLYLLLFIMWSVLNYGIYSSVN